MSQQNGPTALNRRQFLMFSLGMVLWPGVMLAGKGQAETLAWDSFLEQIRRLADEYAGGEIASDVIAGRGVHYLSQLNTASTEFDAAVEESFESGNRFWTWQRMLKEDNVNGGLLTIDDQQYVQLHDHPGATGMLRILSGKAEIWQFDRVATRTVADGNEIAELKRVSRRILGPGDMAVLTPDKGNIHALRVVGNQCRMLDFFIPPYKAGRRSWYQPVNENWTDMEAVTCLSIPQYEFALT